MYIGHLAHSERAVAKDMDFHLPLVHSTSAVCVDKVFVSVEVLDPSLKKLQFFISCFILDINAVN